MSRYLIRLDDASEKMNVKNWELIENLLDKYNIKPLVGVIPHCEDMEMEKYPIDNFFWEKVKKWEKKEWIIAMHGYNHVYTTKSGGINPINKRSEFADVDLSIQKDKIKKGLLIFKNHDINVDVFFAPSHTFDKNTLKALKEESNIKVISDTVANDSYAKYGFIFIPQQCGRVKTIHLKTVCFCYHPNSMKAKDFDELENFIKSHKIDNFTIVNTKRKFSFYDWILARLYFLNHRLRKIKFLLLGNRRKKDE